MAFSVGEEELKGLDTAPLVGHLAAWSYFQSIDTPENKSFVANWQKYRNDPKAVTNDPMESSYDLFNLWAQAVAKAGSTGVDAVSKAIVGEKVKSPTGYDVVMNPNHHLTKPVFIGEIQANGQFSIVYESKPITPHPWSPFLPQNVGKQWTCCQPPQRGWLALPPKTGPQSFNRSLQTCMMSSFGNAAMVSI